MVIVICQTYPTFVILLLFNSLFLVSAFTLSVTFLAVILWNYPFQLLSTLISLSISCLFPRLFAVSLLFTCYFFLFPSSIYLSQPSFSVFVCFPNFSCHPSISFNLFLTVRLFVSVVILCLSFLLSDCAYLSVLMALSYSRTQTHITRCYYYHECYHYYWIINKIEYWDNV